GSGRFATVTYRMIRENGRSGLLVTATEKSNGPPFMRFAAEINGARPNAIDYNLGARITALDVGTPGSELRTDLAVGTHLGAATEYYHPIAGKLFVAPRLFTTANAQDVYQQGARVAEYRQRQ